MEMAAANNKFEMSRLPQCVDGNNSIVENMERFGFPYFFCLLPNFLSKQKMDFLEAVEKQMQMEEGRRDCNGLPNGIRPMDFCNGSNNLPPGMMGPGGPGCPPPGMQFDPHQQQQQMVMIARQQGMQPICLNGGGPPFPGGPPHHMAPHPHHPQFFGVGPGGEMQQIHPGMRPQHMHMRHPMMSPHHHHQMMNGPQSQTGGPMMGPQQQQQMMPPGMMNHHSPMFPPPAGSGGPQQLQQQMNFGGGEGPPPNQQQHQLFYQQQQQQQQGGGAGIPRMNGGFPSPAEQFAAHQNGGMMPPPNGKAFNL
jgi:hypothetical protein